MPPLLPASLPSNPIRQVLFRKIKAGRFEFPTPHWDPITESAKDFICKLLVVDPSKRMTMEEAKQHSWLGESPNPRILSSVVMFRSSLCHSVPSYPTRYTPIRTSAGPRRRSTIHLPLVHSEVKKFRSRERWNSAMGTPASAAEDAAAAAAMSAPLAAVASPTESTGATTNGSALSNAPAVRSHGSTERDSNSAAAHAGAGTGHKGSLDVPMPRAEAAVPANVALATAEKVEQKMMTEVSPLPLVTNLYLWVCLPMTSTLLHIPES